MSLCRQCLYPLEKGIHTCHGPVPFTATEILGWTDRVNEANAARRAVEVERNKLLLRVETLERQLSVAEEVLGEYSLYDEYERRSRPPFNPAI